VNPRKRRAVRATTVAVAPPAPVPVSTGGIFPVKGAYDFGGADARFGAWRAGHKHQGQDISAVEGTPVVAPKSGVIHWRAYQADGAGYYLVLDVADEDFMYVFMHLRQGSLLVSKGDTVTAGQQIAQVGNTGRSFGAHLHFELWQGVWYGGGDPIDPLPTLKSWQAAG
jgi:murein DD-endopeptidase MepM/ murein hydrolase activator NlpD